MKTEKGIIVTAIYKGVIPITEEEKAYNDGYGVQKYIGYDHVFKNVDGPGLFYAICRAKDVPEHFEIDKEYEFICNFKSSILTHIQEV